MGASGGMNGASSCISFVDISGAASLPALSQVGKARATQARPIERVQGGGPTARGSKDGIAARPNARKGDNKSQQRSFLQSASQRGFRLPASCSSSPKSLLTPAASGLLFRS